MRHRTLATLALMALLLVAPTAAAQEDGITIDVDTQPGEAARAETAPGQSFILWANVTVPDRENTSWRATLNASLDGTPLPGPEQLQATNGTLEIPLQFQVPSSAEAGEQTLAWTVVVESLNTSSPPPSNGTDGNQTSGNETTENETTENGTATQDGEDQATWEEVETQTGTMTFTVAPPAPPPTGPPWGIIAGIGVALLLVVAGVVVYAKWPRQYGHDAGPRSQTLRDLEGPGSGAGATGGTGQVLAGKEQEVHPQVKILQARASDVRRMIDLAQERHERGDITEHQFNMIREKKEAELEEIEEEIERYRSGDAE